VAPPWVTIESSQNVKMESGEEEGVATAKKKLKKLWSHHYSSTYLQNCHSGQQNYKNATMG